MDDPTTTASEGFGLTRAPKGYVLQRKVVRSIQTTARIYRCGTDRPQSGQNEHKKHLDLYKNTKVNQI